MKQVIIHIEEKEQNNFIKLVKKLKYVKKIEINSYSTKKKTLENIRKGFEEMKKLKDGKLETTTINEFLNEL